MIPVRETSLDKRTKRTPEDKKKAKELIEKMRDEDSRMVTGIFRNMEVPGGDFELSYKMYPGDTIKTYHFEDGKEATIPIGLAKYINNNLKVPIRDYLRNAKGERMLDTCIGGWRQLKQFVSKEFM